MKWIKFFFVFLSIFIHSQSGFRVSDTEKKVVIPFQLVNNLVFINLQVNGVELTFLLDTGVSETLLFSTENQEIKLNHVEKMKFSGLGENLDVEGLKSVNNIVTADNYKDYGHTIFIILDADFNISSHVGIPVNGIIGYHFFKNYPVEINYSTKKITIYNDPNYFNKKVKKYAEFPISLQDNKPYIIADVEMTKEKSPAKLLIDSGNSDALWLFPKLISNFVYNRPYIDDYLGRGFNGDIYGKRSRIHQLYLGDFKFPKPVTAMPDEYSIQNIKTINDRKGSIGSEILRRFTTIFDYPNKKIYLKKNKNYGEPFLFNMSGIDFMHSGILYEKEFLEMGTPQTQNVESGSQNIAVNSFQYKLVLKPIFSIAGVRKGSVADIAGLKKDDVLVSVNGKSTSDLKLEDLVKMMSSNEGKNFIFVVKRLGKTLQLSFYLEDPIPYQENP